VLSFTCRSIWAIAIFAGIASIVVGIVQFVPAAVLDGWQSCGALARLPPSRENVVNGVGTVASWLAVLGSAATARVVCQPEIRRRQGRTRCGCRAGARPRD
jgi:hypothetical protein